MQRNPNRRLVNGLFCDNSNNNTEEMTKKSVFEIRLGKQLLSPRREDASNRSIFLKRKQSRKHHKQRKREQQDEMQA